MFMGWKDGDVIYPVHVSENSPVEIRILTDVKLFLNLQQTFHYHLIYEKSKHSTGSHSKLENTTLISFHIFLTARSGMNMLRKWRFNLACPMLPWPWNSVKVIETGTNMNVKFSWGFCGHKDLLFIQLRLKWCKVWKISHKPFPRFTISMLHLPTTMTGKRPCETR